LSAMLRVSSIRSADSCVGISRTAGMDPPGRWLDTHNDTVVPPPSPLASLVR
jgi:hypothetical protein